MTRRGRDGLERVSSRQRRSLYRLRHGLIDQPISGRPRAELSVVILTGLNDE
jgi:hypothetical protein